MATVVNPEAAVPGVPAWIVNKKCAEQYNLGVAWYQSSTDERIPGPLTERYPLDNLRWMSEKGLFNGAHDEWALELMSFILGMLSQEAL